MRLWGTPAQHRIRLATVDEWNKQYREPGSYGERQERVAQAVADRLGITFERAENAAYQCHNEARRLPTLVTDENLL